MVFAFSYSSKNSLTKIACSTCFFLCFDLYLSTNLPYLLTMPAQSQGGIYQINYANPSLSGYAQACFLCYFPFPCLRSHRKGFDDLNHCSPFPLPSPHTDHPYLLHVPHQRLLTVLRQPLPYETGDRSITLGICRTQFLSNPLLPDHHVREVIR